MRLYPSLSLKSPFFKKPVLWIGTIPFIPVDAIQKESYASAFLDWLQKRVLSKKPIQKKFKTNSTGNSCEIPDLTDLGAGWPKAGNEKRLIPTDQPFSVL